MLTQTHKNVHTHISARTQAHTHTHKLKLFISPGMRLGVYMACDWLFFNLLPTDSYVMCDHFSNVAGHLFFSAMKH